MKNDELYDLIQGLQDPGVRLPSYRAGLRKRLLTLHARDLCSIRVGLVLLPIRGVIASRQKLRIGLVIITGLIILLGLLTLLSPAGGSSNQKLVAPSSPVAPPDTHRPTPSSVHAAEPAAAETSARGSAQATNIETVQPSTEPAPLVTPPSGPITSGPPTSAISGGRPVTVADSVTDLIGDLAGPGSQNDHKNDKALKDKQNADKDKEKPRGAHENGESNGTD